MQWVGVRQLLVVYCVMGIAGKVVKEGGNVEAMMHLLMSIVIVKVCANAMQQTVVRTNAVVGVNQAS